MTATHLYGAQTSPLAVRTALCLDEHDLLSVAVHPGDRLRGERGTVWITVDGELQDILLEPGQEHRVQQAGALNVSALHGACVSVLGALPLAWRRVRPQRWGAGVAGWVQQLGRRLAFYNAASAASAAGR